MDAPITHKKSSKTSVSQKLFVIKMQSLCTFLIHRSDLSLTFENFTSDFKLLYIGSGVIDLGNYVFRDLNS